MIPVMFMGLSTEIGSIFDPILIVAGKMPISSAEKNLVLVSCHG